MFFKSTIELTEQVKSILCHYITDFISKQNDVTQENFNEKLYHAIVDFLNHLLKFNLSKPDVLSMYFFNDNPITRKHCSEKNDEFLDALLYLKNQFLLHEDDMMSEDIRDILNSRVSDLAISIMKEPVFHHAILRVRDVIFTDYKDKNIENFSSEPFSFQKRFT